MNTKLWLGGVVLAGLCGCSSMNNTERGALVGGGLGSGIGALAGAATGRPLAGALIGGGAGALLGGAVGNSEDRAEKRQAQAVADYAARNPPLAMNDIVQMTQRHISDELIVRQMETTDSYYALTAQDITFLREQGVSERVIMVMQSRRGPAPRRVVIVEPPPPPVAVGVGIGYGRRY